MEDPISDNIHNGDIEWQPLALTLVEYPKGCSKFLILILTQYPMKKTLFCDYYFKRK